MLNYREFPCVDFSYTTYPLSLLFRVYNNPLCNDLPFLPLYTPLQCKSRCGIIHRRLTVYLQEALRPQNAVGLAKRRQTSVGKMQLSLHTSSALVNLNTGVVDA
ncbi:hypothetical protein CEXT_145411 [Caerostris extrusa]|uniref:Uncharacterized protein n=1 Tax=Caerostris extrusa TaxID=172846 RepID=A0AAV4Q809_CAEEX|nr:hypothetical protein CEXT_145411 [Caerostris extrusa]